MQAAPSSTGSEPAVWSVDDAGERNVIAGSGKDGIDIIGAGTDGNIVAGNFIGTDPTGTIPLGITGDGVLIASGASGNWVGVDPYGGAEVGDESNVISGTGDDGVQIDGADDNTVAGNEIGTDLTGTIAVGNAMNGVEIDSSSGNTIGGPEPSGGDLIADNGGAGVVVGSTVTDLSVGNRITGNRIFGNTGQAIDLGDDGITHNADSPGQGPNNVQNFPVVVVSTGGQLEGWLGGSTPNTIVPDRSLRQRGLRLRWCRSGPGLSRIAECDRPTARARPSSTSPSPRRPGCRSSPPRPPTLKATPPKSRPCAGPPWQQHSHPFALYPTSPWYFRRRRATALRSRTPMRAR